MTDKMQRVFVANGEVQGQQVRAFLEAAGIPTEVHGESLRHTHGLTVSDLGSVEIFVDEADVEQARSLLDSARRENSASARMSSLQTPAAGDSSRMAIS